MKATSNKVQLQRDTVQQETHCEEAPQETTRKDTGETTDQSNTEVKPSEKRRNEHNEEERQEEKKRRLGQLSKRKSWLHWKSDMEGELRDNVHPTVTFPNKNQRGPIMTLYVQDNHEE